MGRRIASLNSAAALVCIIIQRVDAEARLPPFYHQTENRCLCIALITPVTQFSVQIKPMQRPGCSRVGRSPLGPCHCDTGSGGLQATDRSTTAVLDRRRPSRNLIGQRRSLRRVCGRGSTKAALPQPCAHRGLSPALAGRSRRPCPAASLARRGVAHEPADAARRATSSPCCLRAPWRRPALGLPLCGCRRPAGPFWVPLSFSAPPCPAFGPRGRDLSVLAQELLLQPPGPTGWLQQGPVVYPNPARQAKGQTKGCAVDYFSVFQRSKKKSTVVAHFPIL